jgi:hypothetical protein
MFFLNPVQSFVLGGCRTLPAEMKVENDDSFTRIGPNGLDALRDGFWAGNRMVAAGDGSR